MGDGTFSPFFENTRKEISPAPELNYTYTKNLIRSTPELNKTYYLCLT